CWMRVWVPEKFEPLDCRVRVMVYQVADQEQLRTLYSVFDRGKARSAAHIGNVLLLGTKAADGMQRRHIALLRSGFKIFWSEEGRRVHMSENDWCGIIENNYATIFNVVGR